MISGGTGRQVRNPGAGGDPWGEANWIDGHDEKEAIDLMGSVRFVFVFQELDVWRSVSWEPTVWFVSQRWSVRFVSFCTYSTYFPFRFVSFPFHRRFVTSASSLEEKNTICWRRACGSGGLERIVDLRVCKSNVENAT